MAMIKCLKIISFINDEHLIGYTSDYAGEWAGVLVSAVKREVNKKLINRAYR